MQAVVVSAAVGTSFIYGTSSGTITAQTAYLHGSENWMHLSAGDYSCAGGVLPEGKVDPGMTYDLNGNRVVMWGGYNVCTATTDRNTSVYHGETGGKNGQWSTLSTSGTTLSSEQGAAMAYCPAECVYLAPDNGFDFLYGGINPNGYFNGVLFGLEGTTWSAVCNPANQPCFYSSYVYSGNTITTTCSATTNGFDVWQQYLEGASLAWDPADQSLYLFGGLGLTYINGCYKTSSNGCAYQSSVCFFDDMWRLTYNTADFGATYPIGWEPVCGEFATGTACGPSNRAYASMAYDPSTGYLVLYGGYGCSTASNLLCTTTSSPGVLTDTWYFAPSGTTWTKCTSTTTVYSCASTPANGADAAMTYDYANGSLLLFGGCSAGFSLATNDYPNGCTTPVQNSWVMGKWTGTTPLLEREWVGLGVLSPSPPASWGARMVYDLADGYIVWYGGEGSAYWAQTWIYSYGH